MLAESPVFLVSASLAWLVFVALFAIAVSAIPLVVWLVRCRLPQARRESISLEAVRFGASERARRSPRHAVLQHRSLIAALLLAVLVIFLLPGIVAMRALGVAGLQVAVAFVLPTFLVMLHARQRSLAR